MDNQRKVSVSAPAVGGVSLLVVFAVLCLTVFALLSLATVQADARLADASVQAVSDYYAADTDAQRILARLRSGEIPPEVTAHTEDSRRTGTRYTYSCPISDSQELQVEVLLEGKDYTILSWRAVTVSEWEFDDSLDLWDGLPF